MAFKMIAPADERRTVTGSLSVADWKRLFNGLQLDIMSDPGSNPEKDKLLETVAKLLE